MQRPDSNPDVDVVVVVVVADAANHANDILAILIVDVLATFYPVDAVVYLVVLRFCLVALQRDVVGCRCSSRMVVNRCCGCGCGWLLLL